MNREQSDWQDIAEKRVYALSSTSDKKEFNPPIRRVAPTMTTSLFHLAEAHEQVPDDPSKELQNRFERFVNQSAQSNPSFLDFRLSKSYELFSDEYSHGRQIASTPTQLDEEIEYEDFELQGPSAKRFKY